MWTIICILSTNGKQLFKILNNNYSASKTNVERVNQVPKRIEIRFPILYNEISLINKNVFELRLRKIF